MSIPKRKRLEVEHRGDCTIVNFVDRKLLHDEVHQKVREELLSLFEEEGKKLIVINFGNVEYLSSSYIGPLISLRKKVGGAEGRMILCGIDSSIIEFFRITQMDRFFEIVPEEQDALRLLEQISRARAWQCPDPSVGLSFDFSFIL